MASIDNFSPYDISVINLLRHYGYEATFLDYQHTDSPNGALVFAGTCNVPLIAERLLHHEWCQRLRHAWDNDAVSIVIQRDAPDFVPDHLDIRVKADVNYLSDTDAKTIETAIKADLKPVCQHAFQHAHRLTQLVSPEGLERAYERGGYTVIAAFQTDDFVMEALGAITLDRCVRYVDQGLRIGYLTVAVQTPDGEEYSEFRGGLDLMNDDYLQLLPTVRKQLRRLRQQHNL